MGKKLPKNCRDWYLDVLRCATARFNSRVRLRRKDYGEWMKAKDLLNASEDPIYIQPTGQYKGQVVGIPKKIGPNIYQYLCDVVKEIRPVIHPEDEAQPLADFNVLDQSGAVRPQAEPNNPTTQIEGIPWVVDRKYRDSAYSVLASMYSQLRPDRHLQLKTSEVTAGMRNFTDLDIEYDHRSRKNGAFKSMDQLVDKRLVNKNKSGGWNGGNYYSLTRDGLRVCYYLFHVKFSPTANPTYALVRPKGNCVATADGNVQETGQRGAAVNGLPHGQDVTLGLGVLNAGAAGYGNNDNSDDIGVFGHDFGYEDRDVQGAHGVYDVYGGSGAKKRPFNDLDTATYALDAEEVRNKRLKRFGHIATPTTSRATSSSSNAKNATTSSLHKTTHPSANYPATPSTHTRTVNTTDYSNPTSSSYPTQYTDNFQTDSQAADELEEIQLQSILAFSEQEARLEALYREEQRLLELQEQALRGDASNSADEEEEEYEIRQEVYYKGQRVPDSVDRACTSTTGSSSAAKASDYSTARANSSSSSSRSAAHSWTSHDEDWNAKPSAYEFTTTSGSSSSKGASLINLDYPTIRNTTSTATSSSHRVPSSATPAQPSIALRRETSSISNQPTDNASVHDSEDEDYRRAIAESMLTDSVVKSKPNTKHTNATNMTTSANNSASMATSAASLPTPTLTNVSSPDEVIYIETPRKALSTTLPATTSRSTILSTSLLNSTPRPHCNPAGAASAAPKEIITVLDESQEDSQDIVFHSYSSSKSNAATTGAAKAMLATKELSESSAVDVVEVDTSPSPICPTRLPHTESKRSSNDATTTQNVTTYTTSSSTPLVSSTRPEPVVYELEDSQNDISASMDSFQVDSPEVVLLSEPPVSSSAVRNSAMNGTSSSAAALGRNSSATPEVRTFHDSGSTLGHIHQTPAVLGTILEIEDTQSPIPIHITVPTATHYTRLTEEEVITIEDSQPPDDVYTDNNSDAMNYDGAYDLSQSPSYTSLTIDRATTSVSTAAVGVRVSKSAAMLAAYANLTKPTTAVTSTKSSGTIQHTTVPIPSVHTTPQYTATYIATLPNTITITVTSHLPSYTVLPVPLPATASKLVLLVDVRERNKQAFYRKFFYDIEAKCNAHLTLGNANTISNSCRVTDYSVEQDKLELGDIAIAYEDDTVSIVDTNSRMHSTLDSSARSKAKKTSRTNNPDDSEADTTPSTYYLTGLIVERKALSDLISRSAGDARSRCGTAAHMVQECRLRHSGCKKAFMCIEGSMNVANIHAVPLVWKDRDYTHPDVIENMEGIVSYMCAVIARNFSPHNVVRVVQTVCNSATCQLFAAMLAVEVYTANTVSSYTTSSSSTSLLPLKSDFEKYYRSIGASKRGREAELRQSLEFPIVVGTSSVSNSYVSGGTSYVEDTVVSEEMVERLVRRFGCWDALLSAYKQCYTSKMRSDSNTFTTSTSASSSNTNLNTTIYSATATTSAEVRCMLMLCDLTVGGTLADRTNMTASSSTSATDCTHASPTLQHQSAASLLLMDSLLVWHHARLLLCEEGFLQYHTSNSGIYSTSSGTSSQGRLNSAVPDSQVMQYLDSLHTSLRTIQPHKVTHVAISAAMVKDILQQYTFLDKDDFVCQLLPSAIYTSSSATAIADTEREADGQRTGRKRKSEIIPGGGCTYLNCPDQKYPYMYLQSIDNNEYTGIDHSAAVSVRRCSMRTVVSIVSALDIVEAIIFATAQYKLQHSKVDWSKVSVFADNHRCLDIIRQAMTSLTARLPEEYSDRGNAARVPTQCVLIVEGLIHSTSPSATAMGKLESALNTELNATSILGTNGSSSSGGSSVANSSSSTSHDNTFTLGYGRPSLPLAEARDVSANQAWLVHLFLACVSMKGLAKDANLVGSSVSGNEEVGCQCFLTQNAEQTERFVYALIHETHRQSLLLY